MNPYLDPQRVRAALRALELRPTRGMGQNFLIDGTALDAIVNAAELTPADLVVEVGPGLGVLTWELTQRAGYTVAVELDRRLAARLHDEFSSAPLSIVQSDVLRVTPSELVAASPRRLNDAEEAELPGLRPAYKLVANLPYAITAPVLRHFLEAAQPPELSVVLVQLEVAQRITAAPGDLSVLAHAMQFYAEPEIVARVPAASFLPAPAVDSAVLRLRRRPQPAVAVDSVERLFRVIKAGFLQPRKQLGNALPGGLAALGVKLGRDAAQAALQVANINPMRRAETLTLAEWAALYTALAESL
jgi:16S rRNA (adenine1518-N6/adenine1519-N6)-dimethyltransferase